MGDDMQRILHSIPLFIWAAPIALIIFAGIKLLPLRAQTQSTSPPQATGAPGSPDATTTINGKQLPAPPEKFGGVIKETAKTSKSYWPPSIVPPKGAPNI